nr:helix-turn-helix domain-containing protein [Neobacillus sp. 179.-C4.2 HS]MDP5195055.1 helix-turn-helix domain-containing protein [Neobacillus sp. 179.-C4.2 HS]
MTNQYCRLPDVLDVKDIKTFLNIGRAQAYELANSGAFHVVRINRRIKIPKQNFVEWFEGRGDQ